MADITAITEPHAKDLRLAPVPFAQQVAIWSLFLLSGACALIYEVLWCRQLGLIFGNTVHSLSAVLTAFMAGLAFGSFMAGRVCHRLRRPLLVYGLLELSIGIYCALLPWIFSDHGPLVPIYRSLYGEAGSGSLAVTRFAVSFVLMLIPTTFMGATLPVLSQYLVRSNRTLGRTVGTLYAVNTLGAVVGAAATGFILLPALGKIGTNWVAVAFNAVLALSAIVLGWKAVLPQAENEKEEEKPAESENSFAPSISPAAVKFAVIAFGITGFAAMATQIGWTRAISLGTGSSTYAFSLIVSVFILGLSAGGWWASRVAARARDVVRTLALVLLSIGLLNMALAALLGLGPLMFFFLLAWGSNPGSGEMSWSLLLAIQALGIALLIIVPTFLMGATMPLTLQVAAADSSRDAGRTVGNVYAINTVGSILGSFFGGLAVLPLLGIQTTLQAMALFYAIPGIVLLVISPSWRRESGGGGFAKTQWMAGILSVVVLAGCFAPRWDPKVMSAGMFLLRDHDAVNAAREWRMDEAVPNLNRQILYYREGAAATVAVAKVGETMSLSVGGKPDASSHGDMTTQLGLTMIPTVLHAEPRDVLVIGMGSGVSAGAALARQSVQHVDVVEMSPEVITGSSWFKDYNFLTYNDPMTDHATLNTPRLNVLINDGRNHLLLSSRKYDVIASEPSNPWMAGVGNLFTQEAFQLSRERLNPGGIMCQWLHTYSLEESHVYTIIRTFGDVYPHFQLWWINKGDLLLIGSDAPLCIPVKALRERLREPTVKTYLSRVNYDTEYEFIAGFIQHDDFLRKKAAGHPLHTDDNMLLEFSAPRALYGATQNFGPSQFTPLIDDIVDLQGLSTEEKAEFIRGMDLAVGAREHLIAPISTTQRQERHMDRAWQMAPHQYWASAHRVQQAEATLPKQIGDAVYERIFSGGAAADALKSIDEELSATHSRRWSDAIITRATRRMGEGRTDDALNLLRMVDDPRRRGTAELVRASVLAMQGKFDDALALIGKVAGGGHDPVECANAAGSVLIDAGRDGDAIANLMQVLENPGAAHDVSTYPLWLLLARARLHLADYEAAENAARFARKLKPLDPEAYGVMAAIEMARRRYAEALAPARRRYSLDPSKPAALQDLMMAAMAYAETEADDKRLNYCDARRLSRELVHWNPASLPGWTVFARSTLALSRLDEPNADVYSVLAKSAARRVLKLSGDDLAKLPTDLRALVQP